MPWWCAWPPYYWEVVSFTKTGSNNSYTQMESAEGWGPQNISLLTRSTESFEATASNTIGINDGVVCQTTLGVSLGWSVMIGSAHQWAVPTGEYWICYLDDKVYNEWGNASKHHYQTGAFCGCWGTYYSHWHFGTYTASKHEGTRGRHTVVSP
jgi:hypothetical protein